jgi:hypothetical protein
MTPMRQRNQLAKQQRVSPIESRHDAHATIKQHLLLGCVLVLFWPSSESLIPSDPSCYDPRMARTKPVEQDEPL